jgi:hypothetical protein
MLDGVPKYRTYDFTLTCLNASTQQCDDFKAYVLMQISRRGILISFVRIEDISSCIFRFRVRMQSLGKNSPNRFIRDLGLDYPDAQYELNRSSLD